MKIQELNYLVIQEYIKLGQRVKSFQVDGWENGAWSPIASATTIGYKRIVELEGVITNRLRISISNSKASPVISNVEIY